MTDNAKRMRKQANGKAGYGLERFIHDSPTYKMTLLT